MAAFSTIPADLQRDVFDYYDFDKSGALEANELKCALIEMGFQTDAVGLESLIRDYSVENAGGRLAVPFQNFGRVIAQQEDRRDQNFDSSEDDWEDDSDCGSYDGSETKDATDATVWSKGESADDRLVQSSLEGGSENYLNDMAAHGDEQRPVLLHEDEATDHAQIVFEPDETGSVYSGEDDSDEEYANESKHRHDGVAKKRNHDDDRPNVSRSKGKGGTFVHAADVCSSPRAIDVGLGCVVVLAVVLLFVLLKSDDQNDGAITVVGDSSASGSIVKAS